MLLKNMKHFILFILLLTLPLSVLAENMKGPLFYTEAGKGETLILIHAFPFDHHLWRRQQEELKNYFHVITVDLWGFGYSGSASDDGSAVTMETYADEIKQVLDELNIHQAIIGGESMGGYVGLAFLKKYPDRVSGLVLSDTQCIADTEEQKAAREASAIDVIEHGSDNLITNFLPKALSPHASYEDRLAVRRMMISQEPMAIAAAIRGMALREDTCSLLGETKLPVLILSGDQDAIISLKQGEMMHKLAKNSHFIVMKNAGHLSNLEAADQWNIAVIRMFSQQK